MWCCFWFLTCWRRKRVSAFCLGSFYPVDCRTAFYSGAVLVGVVAEGFDYCFVALHVIDAFLCCSVDVSPVSFDDF